MNLALKNTPSAYQRTIDNALTQIGYHCVLLYLDGIIIVIKLLEEHLSHVTKGKWMLQEAEATLRLWESSINRTQVGYLGSVI